MVKNYRHRAHDEQTRPTTGNQTGKADAEAAAGKNAKGLIPGADLSTLSSTASIDTKAQPKSGESVLHYYLQLIPQPANAPRRVLHLRPGHPLRDWFRDRTFLEFPTIYVLEASPTELDAKNWAVDNVIGEGTAYVIDTTGAKGQAASEPGRAGTGVQELF